MEQTPQQTPMHVLPDHEDRLQDFFARHGGASNLASRAGESAHGTQGWSEVYARDGYTLRFDWSAMGTREQMQYLEIPPSSRSTP